MKDNEKLDEHGIVGSSGRLRAHSSVPTDADLAYMGLTEHQIGIINAIPPGEGQDVVRQEVMDEQAKLLMERESGYDSFSGRFGDIV